MSETDGDRSLDRRHLLAGLAGTGLVGAGGYVTLGGTLDPGGTDLPVDVTTIDAEGSTAGTATIPTPDTPTVIDCFATWCGPCIEQMDGLGTVYDRYGDRAAFVSVTNERFGGGLDPDELRAWWRENDGRWTLGHDPAGDLLAALGASGLPHLAVADETGTVIWSHDGVASVAALDRAISSVV